MFSTTWLFLGGSSEPLLRTRGEARSDTKGFYHRAPVHPERDVSVATLELYDRAWPTEQMVKRIGELRDRGISPVSVNTYLRRIDAYFNCSDGVWTGTYPNSATEGRAETPNPFTPEQVIFNRF